MTRLPNAQKSYAILVGADKYGDDSLADLPAVRNNVNTLATLLAAPSYGDLAGDHCITLHNPSGPRETYSKLIQYAKAAQDTLIIYFAGHGLTGPSRHELYLCLSDTDPEESQLPVSALSIDQIHKIFEYTPAHNRVLILDCCYSGRAVRDFMANYDDLILGQVEIKGGYTMAATPSNATALAPPGDLYTAFTGELVTVLRKGIPNGQKLLTLDAIFRQLHYVAQTKGLPLPRQRGSDTVHLLALSKNAAYRHAGHEDRDPPKGDDYDDLRALSARARALRESGDHSEAAHVLRELIGVQNRLLGAQHPDILSSRQDLAFALNAAGDVLGASRILQELFDTQLFKVSDEEASSNSASSAPMAPMSIMNFWGLALRTPLFISVFFIFAALAHLPAQLGFGNYLALTMSIMILLFVGGISVTASMLISEIWWEKVVLGLIFLGCALGAYLPARLGQPWFWTGHIARIVRDWLVWRF